VSCIPTCNGNRTRHLAGIANARIRVRASSTLEAFDEHWPRSQRMGDAVCSIFQCADLIEIWLDTVGRARRTCPVFVGVYDADGRPMVLLPLGIERHRGVRVLTFLDGTVVDYNQPIMFPAAHAIDAAAWSEIWATIVRALPTFDVAIFDRMPERVGALPNPLVRAGSVPLPQSGHVMSLVGSGADNEARLPHRKGRDRLRRRLSERGPVALAVAGSAAEAEAFLQQVLAGKARQFARTRVPGFELPGKRAFYLAATRRLACPETVHVSALKIGGAVIACHWGLVLGGRFYLILTTYDADWKRFSPGALHHEALIRWCHARGMSAFDFGIGDEAYKGDYCDARVPLHRVEIGLSRRGRIHLAVARAMAWMRNTSVWGFLRPLKWIVLRAVRRPPA
jgi:CelD/BcsL family acetyltransferase involved in cellulose biosynthesis